MAIPAFIEKVAPAGDKARSARRKLRLQVHGTRAAGGDVIVSVHNISATGLLLEGDVALAQGDGIDIVLPHAGSTRARVIWASGALYGCEFETPVSPATLWLRSVGSLMP
jgi:hypothetical protein